MAEGIARAEEALAQMVAHYGDERTNDFNGQPRHRDNMQRWRQTIIDLRAAAPPVFNQAALEQIIAGIAAAHGPAPAPAAAPAAGPAAAGPAPGHGGQQAGRAKAQLLESADPKHWRTWRNHIGLVIEENDYAAVNHDRAKRMIKINLYGEAEELTRDIEYITADEAAAAGDDEETWNEFLDRLQDKFLPRSAQMLARTVFEASKQRTDETLGRFHARLLSEFNLAYPNADDPNLDQHVIRRFCYGLRDSVVQTHVLQGDPQAYGDCLQLAEARYAVMSAVASCHRPGGGRINAMESKGAKDATKLIVDRVVNQISQMDMRTRTSGTEANRKLRKGEWEGKPGANEGGKRCYQCESPYHLIADCKQDELANPGRGAARGGGGRGGGSGSSGSSVGAVSGKSQKKDEKKKRKATKKKLAPIEETGAPADVQDAATQLLASMMDGLKSGSASEE